MANATLKTQLESLLLLPEEEDEFPTIPVRKETVERAIECIKQFKKVLQEKKGIELEDLKVSRGPEGSIDAYWYPEDYKRGALLNVPADKNKPATYYWETKDGDNLSGKL